MRPFLFIKLTKMLADQIINKTESSKQKTQSWSPDLIPVILQDLEQPNWAPWLAAGYESLIGRIQVFPEGQIVLLNETEAPIASISTNRIYWNGRPESLPSWDEVAGEPTTYENTYQPEGNAIVLMSANVAPDYQGQGFGKVLINSVVKVASSLGGIEHIIGSFRPTGYGKHQLEYGENALPFGKYCFTSDPTAIKDIDYQIDWSPWGGSGPPLDPWLRNLARNGMVPITVDPLAMQVMVSSDELDYYKASYKPENWFQLPDGTWLCGEVGKFYPQANGSYLYKEENLWGQIPFNQQNHG